MRDFLVGMLKSADPDEETNPVKTVSEVVERAAATVDERFGQHPLLEAEIQQTMGEVSMALRTGDPIHAFRRAYSIRDSLLGPDDPATLKSLQLLAINVEWAGETEEGERLHRKAVETAMRVFGPDDSTTCDALIALGRSLLTAKNNLGLILVAMHRYDEATPLLEQALNDAHQLYGYGAGRAWPLQKNLADCLLASGRAGDAEPLYRALRNWNRGSSKPNPLIEAACRVGLAEAAAAQGRTAQAHREIRTVMEGLESEPAPNPVLFSLALTGYARVLIAMDSLRAIVPLLEESGRIATGIDDSLSLLLRQTALFELACVFDRLGERERAEECRSELPAYLLEADAAREVRPAVSRP